MYGQQTRLQKYCKFFRKQHTIDKFDSVINQLDEHSEKAWQLADNNAMPMRRRGMRASFSQGLQTSSFVGPTDSSVFDSAECAGIAAAAAPSPVVWYCQCVQAMCAASQCDHLGTHDACPSEAHKESSHSVVPMPLCDGNGHCNVVPVQNHSGKCQARPVVDRCSTVS